MLMLVVVSYLRVKRPAKVNSRSLSKRKQNLSDNDNDDDEGEQRAPRRSG